MIKNMFPKRLVALVLFTGSVVLSCTPFTVPDRSESQLKMPAKYSLSEGLTGNPQQQWWHQFSNSQLDGLVERALAQNLSLRAHWARLERASAFSRKAGSALLPEISGDGTASYAKSGSDENGTSSTEVQRYSLGLVASYELDLWGRVRAGKRSADYVLLASREDLNAAAMTVAAEVARRWIGIVASQEEKQLLLKQLDTNKTYLELTELRFRKSLASAVDVLQQQQLVERIQSQIPLVELRSQLLHNELAVLTGQMPQQLENIAKQTLPTLESRPVPGVPVQLLQNRPDIRAALSRLQAADQGLLVAKADRLPAIRLTGSGGYNGVKIDQIFDNWLLNLAASLTAPLLDGGRRKAEVDSATATVQEQLSLYHLAVLNGVMEVEDALVREEKTREHILRAKQQLTSAQVTLEEARSRYMNGLSDYLPVLTQLLAVQNLEMDLVARHEELLGARIALYRALGGTWTDTLQKPEHVQVNEQDERS